ncbi:Muniscin C-terminal mu homology domain-containing protein [Mrakia frigida]|uniref:Muniscin C-terminal mu homology domain-containing protein n=1 Tax=Mrakia frigida TaxID=29902 RepID=UPI003FCBF125
MADASQARLAPQAYENAFINGPSPRASHNLLQTRLSAAQKLNESLADVYKERAAIEQQYVASLQKLQSKRGPSGGVGARGELGGLGNVWEMVWGEVAETASAHSNLEKKMRDEVEAPLRKMGNKGDWGKLSLFDGNLDKTIKNLESCQTRFQKAQKKVDSSRKEKTMSELSDAQSGLADAQQGWLIESPQVFGLYQAVEEGRLGEIKEILAKWETSRSDVAQREMEGSERVMMGILNWDTMEDLQEFLLKKGHGGGGGGGRSAPPQANGNRNVSNASAMSGMSRAPTVRRQSSVTSSGGPIGGGGGDFNPSNSSSGLGSSLNPLKSVFGRNRNRASSVATSRSGNGTARPGNATNDSYGGGGGGGGFDSLGDGDDEPRDQPQRRETSGGSEGQVEVLEPTRANGSSNSNANGSSSIPAPMVDADGFSVPPPDHDKKPWEIEANNASLMDDDSDMNHSSSTNNEVPQLRLAMAPAPIQESEEERRIALAKVQSTLLAQPPSSAGPTRRGTVRGRRDVRNTMFGGIPDDMPLGQAMGLGAFSGAGKPASRNGSIQETADSPTGSTFSPPAPSFSPISPTITTATATNGNAPASYERSNTMLSTASTQNSLSSPNHNPFDSNPSLTQGGGLRAAITETCNVAARGGVIVKAMVAGEIACSLRDVPQSEVDKNGRIHLRIENFEQMMKIAPNPQFVVPAGPDHPGEYFLDSKALAGAASVNPGKLVVLFKYQLHISEGKASTLVPVTAVPQWKCEDENTKLLINYSLTPTSTLLTSPSSSPFDSPSEPTITDISFSVPISSPTISKPQSKPFPGTYDPATKRILYVGEPLSLSPNGVKENKIVARMAVEEKTVPGPIAVKWVLKGALCSSLGVSVVGGATGASLNEFGGPSEGGWKLEEVVKSVQTGRFTVE